MISRIKNVVSWGAIAALAVVAGLHAQAGGGADAGGLAPVLRRHVSAAAVLSKCTLDECSERLRALRYRRRRTPAGRDFDGIGWTRRPNVKRRRLFRTTVHGPADCHRLPQSWRLHRRSFCVATIGASQAQPERPKSNGTFAARDRRPSIGVESEPLFPLHGRGETCEPAKHSLRLRLPGGVVRRLGAEERPPVDAR